MLYRDKKTGSLRHEKSKPVCETVPCVKCGVGYIYGRVPLTKPEELKGNYICKNCC